MHWRHTYFLPLTWVCAVHVSLETRPIAAGSHQKKGHCYGGTTLTLFAELAVGVDGWHFLLAQAPPRVSVIVEVGLVEVPHVAS